MLLAQFYYYFKYYLWEWHFSNGYPPMGVHQSNTITRVTQTKQTTKLYKLQVGWSISADRYMFYIYSIFNMWRKNKLICLIRESIKWSFPKCSTNHFYQSNLCCISSPSCPLLPTTPPKLHAKEHISYDRYVTSVDLFNQAVQLNSPKPSEAKQLYLESIKSRHAGHWLAWNWKSFTKKPLKSHRKEETIWCTPTPWEI